MHDIKDLDSRGLPGVIVATTAFREAAEAQGMALGFLPRMVFVPHPVMDRTADEVKAMARDVAGGILAGLVESEPETP